MSQIVLIAHNLRSSHNVGSLLRTAEGLGIDKVYLTGYTPYPISGKDGRMPHIAKKVHNQIVKTALGAELTQVWEQSDDIYSVIQSLRNDGYTIAAVEQTSDSLLLPDYHTPNKIAVIVGREVEGVEPEVITACDIALEIPMNGQKESFNVAQAAAMTLYHLKYFPGGS